MGIINKLFSRKELPEFDLSSFGVDIHSHLIPGIDDGAKTMEESMQIFRKFKELGYHKIITTPHIKMGSFENTTQIIEESAEKVRTALIEEGIDLEFGVAAEYYFDYSFIEKIEKDDILSFSDNHVLVEFSFHQRPMGEKEMFFSLQMKKYKPILAHIERYPYYHGSTKNAEELRDRGVLIQVNLLSLFGHYGPQIQKQAALLIKNKQVDILASDCHRLEHLELLQANLKNPLLHEAGSLSLKNSNF